MHQVVAPGPFYFVRYRSSSTYTGFLTSTEDVRVMEWKVTTSIVGHSLAKDKRGKFGV